MSNSCAAGHYLRFPQASRAGVALAHQAETSVNHDTLLMAGSRGEGMEAWVFFETLDRGA